MSRRKRLQRTMRTPARARHRAAKMTRSQRENGRQQAYLTVSPRLPLAWLEHAFGVSSRKGGAK
jgi:hypothetical protein